MATRWFGRPAARITMAAVAVTAAACTALAVPAWAAPGQIEDLGLNQDDSPAREARESSDLKIMDQDRDGNEVRLKVFSPAMHKELPVTVLLPGNYSDGGSFPVLYALPGAGEGDDRTWVNLTDIKDFAKDHGALIVLPPTEHGGFYSDWIDGSRKWETFHTSELPSLIRAKFKGTGRQAVMGISLGGFAAMKYAAHNPGQYAAAAAMSSMLVSSTPGMTAVYQVGMKLNDQNSMNIWGDPIRNSAKWSYEDPSKQVDGLRGTNVFVSASSGLPTFNNSHGDGAPLDRVKTLAKDPGNVKDQVLAVGLEQPSYDTTVLFTRAAEQAGVNVTSSHPLRGQHNWGFWKDEYKVAWSKVIAPSLGLPN